MLNKDIYVYLETSAVNYLLDNFTFEELATIKAASYDADKIRFCISTPTIFEILSTTDIERREQLIYTTQCICYERLINSPSEFIINYIKAGMPKEELKYEFYSDLSIAHVWEDICQDNRKTFIYEFKDIQKRKTFLSKQFKTIVSEIFDSDTPWGRLINKILNLDIKYYKMNDYEILVKKISWVLILIILCAGVSFDCSYIDNFWKQYNCDKTEDRVNFALLNFSQLTEYGPIVMMARMWITQSNSINRGTLLDMFHSIYIVYSDIFLTNDQHFENLRSSDSYKYYEKIEIISKNEFFTELKSFIIRH